MRAPIAVLAASAALALGLGCPPPGASLGSVGAGASACPPGLFAAQGACVEPAVADRQCGKAAHFADGACVPRECTGAQVLDQASGACLGVRALREIGAGLHVVFEDGQTLGCRENALLRVANGHAACFPMADDGGAPQKPRACGPGEVEDVTVHGCVRVVRGGQVDVAAWARARLGADGGPGAGDLCARIGLDPSPFGLGSGAETGVHLTVELVFPNNDVTQVRARIAAQDDDGRPLPGASAKTSDAAVSAAIESLRGLGGTASAASLEVRVGCRVHAGLQPIAKDLPF